MALSPPPNGNDSVLESITGMIEGRTRHINHGFLIVRTLLGAGLAGYLAIGVSLEETQTYINLALSGSYVLATLGLHVMAAGRHSVWTSRLNAALDVGFILLLRHLFGLEILVDPNATMVGLFSLLLIAYALYTDVPLLLTMGFIIVCSTELTLLVDLMVRADLPTLHEAESLLFRTHPLRVVMVMIYLILVAGTMTLLARQLRRQMVREIEEQQDRTRSAFTTSLERLKREKLEELNRLKRNFIALLSHELRTPIAPLCTALEMIESEMPEYDPQRETLEVAVKASGRLRRLAHDYTQLAELLILESDDCLQKNVRLQDLIPPLLEGRQTPSERVVYKIPDDLVVATDPRILGGALLALIRRAELLTPMSEKIELHFKGDHDQVKISLHDPASYVDVEDIKAVNDPFGDSRERLFYSTNSGLELVLAQHALQHVGSELNIDSRRGEGTTVSCILPGRDTRTPLLQEEEVERELDLLQMFN